VRWAASRVRQFSEMPLATKQRWLVDYARRRLPGATAAVAATPMAQRGAGPQDDVDRDVLVLRAQARAAAAYVPGDYDGRIDFIWAEGAPGKEPRSNPVGAWQVLSRDVHLHRLPSGHIGLITGNLPMLADAFRGALDGSSTPGGGTR
jgi:hypothetical protein